MEEVFNYDDLKKWIEYDDNYYNVTLVFYHSDLCELDLNQTIFINNKFDLF